MSKLKKENLAFKNIYSRSAPLTYNKETGTVTGILTTENPVLSFDWYNGGVVRDIILVDGVEIADKIPLLDTHSRYEIASLKGSVINPRIENIEGVGRVWVADYVLSTTAERERTLIEEGHLTNTSIGFEIFPQYTYELKPGETKEINGRTFTNNFDDRLPLLIRAKVKIFENSLVIIGADEAAKIRSQTFEEPEGNDQKEINKPIKQTIKGDIKMEDVNLDQKRVDAINKLAETFATKVEGVDLKETAQLFIQGGKSERDFADFIFERQKQSATFGKPKINLSQKEMKEYDLFRGLRALNSNLSSFEREVSDEYARQMGVTPKGILLPYDVVVPKYFARALTATGTNTGAELVGVDHLGDQFISYLYEALVLNNLTLLPNRKNNVEIPVQTSTVGVGWAATETAVKSEGTLGTAVKTASPKDGGVFTTISKRLMIQSDPPAERLAINDMLNSIARAIQNVVLNGTGSNGQPRGLKNTSGLPTTINFASAQGGITWAKLVQFESSIDDSFSNDKSMYYVTRRSHRGVLKSTPKESGQAIYICDNENRVNGYEMRTTNLVTTGDVFFGDWSQIVVALWDALDVTVDPYTLSTSSQIRITASQLLDVIVRYPQAFAYGNNFGS